MLTADSLKKTLMLGKIEGRRRRGRQRMSWLDGIIDSLDMNFGKLQEIERDTEAWRAVVHGVEKSRTWLGNWTTSTFPPVRSKFCFHSVLFQVEVLFQLRRLKIKARSEFGCWASGCLGAASLLWSWTSFPEMSLLPCSSQWTSILYFCHSGWVFALFSWVLSLCLTFWSRFQVFRSRGSALLWLACPWTPFSKWETPPPAARPFCCLLTLNPTGSRMAHRYASPPHLFHSLDSVPAHVARLSRMPVPQASAWPSKAGVWSQF